LISDDCALLYTIGPGLDMEIHHNWFHDTEGRGSKYKAAGIYLDNDAGNVDVHHNVVHNTEWSSIQINWDAANIDVFNNTFWDGSVAMGAWHKAGTAFSNVRVWNNLVNKNSLEPQSNKQNNLIMAETANPFVNEGALNFMLKSGQQAINYGRVISGITDGYSGSAPDAGAYEFGNPRWLAGVDWNIANGPNNQCYGLPGESCTPGGGGNQTPFTNLTLPGKIEAENFDNGGQGIAYNDLTNGNSGGQYRSTNVDVTNTTDTGGGHTVGWMDAGEWTEYTVNVTQTGTYDFYFRVASPSGAGQIRLRMDGTDISGVVAAPNTGGWQTFQTVTVPNKTLNAGTHVFRLETVTAGLNVNFWSAWLSTPPPPPANPQSPFVSLNIPGKIQAEDYDNGGQGVAYNDSNAANNGGQGRTGEGVDLETTGDINGNLNVGWTVTGEWLEYTVDVAASQNYDFYFRVASTSTNGRLQLLMDGTPVTGVVSVPNTGGWQTYQTLRVRNLPLTAGSHVFRIAVVAGGFNLNFWSAWPATAARPAFNQLARPDDATYRENRIFPNPSTDRIFLTNIPVDARYSVFDGRGRIIARSLSASSFAGGYDVSALRPGVYYLRDTLGNTLRFIRQ
ncbi:MAG: carbohydrate-binding protein, partial [Bacteroidota bacterium]